jgi:hypothetical protein
VLGGLVKGIFDGVICAFQAHTDTAVLPDVVARIASLNLSTSTLFAQGLQTRGDLALGGRIGTL